MGVAGSRQAITPGGDCSGLNIEQVLSFSKSFLLMDRRKRRAFKKRNSLGSSGACLRLATVPPTLRVGENPNSFLRRSLLTLGTFTGLGVQSRHTVTTLEKWG
jgi:hypothetical protein